MILINGSPVKFKEFPNKETLIESDFFFDFGFLDDCNVIFKYEDDSDLIKLMFVKRHLDELDIMANLSITYMPYSRMDRVEGNSVFTLKYMAEFINSLNFNRVALFEPHSDVTPALIDRCKVNYPTIRMLQTVKNIVEFNDKNDYLFFPDAGAQKRYAKLEGNQLVGFKDRDFETGRIKSLSIFGEVNPGRKVIILDDLCSYGGTFMMAANELKKYDLEIYLFVTHCENSIYAGDILKTDVIGKVFITNSIHYETSISNKVHVFRLEDWYHD